MGARPPKMCARKWPPCAQPAHRVKEPRVLRFDPASRPVWSLAVLPDDQAGANANTAAPSAVELTTWAEQVLKNAWKTCAV